MKNTVMMDKIRKITHKDFSAVSRQLSAVSFQTSLKPKAQNPRPGT